MKKFVLILSLFVMTGIAAHAQVRIRYDVVIGRARPNRAEADAMHREEASHPGIMSSIRSIQDAMNSLRNAPSDFGGHKGEAMVSLQNAYIALKKALYYRIYADSH